MATLQRIRNRAGLLVSIFIGFALLAFILGDLLKSGNSIFAKSRTEVAEIAGESVPIQLYQGKVEENVENYKRNSGQNSVDALTMDRLQDQTWDQMLREYIMKDEFKALGLRVSGDELFDMVQGNNIDPQIQQVPIFQNQETGQFDRSLVIQFLKNMDLDPSGKAKSSWAGFEKALAEGKLNKKYNSLIEKALFTTSVQAGIEAENKNKKVSFDYVAAKYNTVSDSLISFTDKDIQSYYNENKDDFERDELREINYVTFTVVPTQEDENGTKKWVADISPEFQSTSNIERFISLNSDIPFDGKYYSKEDLNVNVAYLYDAEKGTTTETYRNDNAFKISKVSDIKNIPDSVKARHILIVPEANKDAMAIADSLKKIVETGGNFAELAKKHSTDGSADKGGDLGWFTAEKMVKPFSDACFFGKKGDLTVVQSQFGVHLIEITNQSEKMKKVQIATLARTIEPSSKTYQDTYAAASKFGGTNRTFAAFKEATTKEQMQVKVASIKKDDKKVANIDNSRQLIRWTYGAKEGEVSEIFEFDNMFLIASVKMIQEEGIASLEDVKMEIEREVKKNKKAEYLIGKFNEASKSGSSIQAIANNMKESVKEVKDATFGAYSLPGIGFEPDLQGIVLNQKADKVSEPIKGKSGVYIVQVKEIKEPAEGLDISNEKIALTRSFRSRVNYQVYEAIKEASNIEDNRSNFY